MKNEDSVLVSKMVIIILGGKSFHGIYYKYAYIEVQSHLFVILLEQILFTWNILLWSKITFIQNKGVTLEIWFASYSYE